MRRNILSVAKGIAAKDGWQNVTIRKICGEICYSAPVIYEYFEGKEQILQAIRMEGIGEIHELFLKVDHKYFQPEKRLLEYGLAWWNFAKRNAELYQVMYNLQGAVCSMGDSQPNTTILDHYHQAFSAINRKAQASEKYRWELCDNFIAIIHGFISLRMVNKIRSGIPNEDQVFANAIQRFIYIINDSNADICQKEN
ncbi:MAG: TetR/AcrR family transcriptional regulator [Chitinophagales bacterium]|nr:TetR/AcrR family transcriptional regulator [Chitinophagales bacterium]